MIRERRWGQPLWVWRVLAASAIPAVMLLFFSQTVSGRIFGVMLLIAEAFTAGSLFLGWAHAERLRFESELGDLGDYGDLEPPL